MAIVIKNTTEEVTTSLVHSNSKFVEPKIWKGKNGKGIYIRLDEKTRLWLAKKHIAEIVRLAQSPA